jgi:hypothetical protein
MIIFDADDDVVVNMVFKAFINLIQRIVKEED